MRFTRPHVYPLNKLDPKSHFHMTTGLILRCQESAKRLYHLVKNRDVSMFYNLQKWMTFRHV